MGDSPLSKTCCSDQPTLWIQPGQATYLGPSFQLDPHSGAVHCLAVGVDAPFELRADSLGGGQHVRTAFIPARTHHQIIASASRMLFHYSDSTEARDHMTVHTQPCCPAVLASSSMSRVP